MSKVTFPLPGTPLPGGRPRPVAGWMSVRDLARSRSPILEDAPRAAARTHPNDADGTFARLVDGARILERA
jgi:hypothetical protein